MTWFFNATATWRKRIHNHGVDSGQNMSFFLGVLFSASSIYFWRTWSKCQLCQWCPVELWICRDNKTRRVFRVKYQEPVPERRTVFVFRNWQLILFHRVLGKGINPCFVWFASHFSKHSKGKQKKSWVSSHKPNFREIEIIKKNVHGRCLFLISCVLFPVESYRLNRAQSQTLPISYNSKMVAEVSR